MNILITNDDGIDAPGIKALEKALAKTGHNCITIAPKHQYSECSHKINTRVKLKLKEEGDNRYSIEGSPADCVRLGLYTQVEKTHLVCSGINAGGNLGVDIYYSGTVAAAREALIHGIPAIAFSNYLKQNEAIDWENATEVIAHKFEQLLEHCSKKSILNINLPWYLKNWPKLEWIESPLERAPLDLSFQEYEDGWKYNGDYPNRKREAGSDVDTCFSGNISMSKVPLAHF